MAEQKSLGQIAKHTYLGVMEQSPQSGQDYAFESAAQAVIAAYKERDGYSGATIEDVSHACNRREFNTLRDLKDLEHKFMDLHKTVHDQGITISNLASIAKSDAVPALQVRVADIERRFYGDSAQRVQDVLDFLNSKPIPVVLNDAFRAVFGSKQTHGDGHIRLDND